MIVVKVGGGQGICLERVVGDLASLGNRFILVHGGSHELNVLQEQLNNPVVTYTSPSGFTSRRTDRLTMQMFQMAYCGKVNKTLVELVQAQGINAIGLCGMDGRLAIAQRKTAIRVVEGNRTRIVHDDLSGRITSINSTLLGQLLNNNYTPIITPPAITQEGVPVNVDGDRLAAAIAVAMNATELIIISNVPGLLRDTNDVDSLIPSISTNSIGSCIQQYAQGRMKRKLLGAQEAIQGGVHRVRITGSLFNQGTVID